MWGFICWVNGHREKAEKDQSLIFMGHQWRICMLEMYIPSMSCEMMILPCWMWPNAMLSCWFLISWGWTEELVGLLSYETDDNLGDKKSVQLRFGGFSVWILMILQPSMAGRLESTNWCAVWVGGMTYTLLHSPVNHSKTNQSQASEMYAEVGREHFVFTALWCIMNSSLNRCCWLTLCVSSLGYD